MAFNSTSNVVLAQQDDDWQDNSLLDSGDAMYEDDHYVPKNEISAKKIALKKFCENLKNNLVFSAGFDKAFKEQNRFGTTDRRFCYCYCPCGKKMAKWQKQFCAPQICNSKKIFTPGALLDHLRSFEGDMYHTAVKFYLHNMYE